MLYILDEPSIGLHPRDNDRLLDTLAQLRDLGNTVVVVEHDEDTMRAADHLIDFGPGPGVRGGEVVAIGTADEIAGEKRSVTGAFLSGKRKIEFRRAKMGWIRRMRRTQRGPFASNPQSAKSAIDHELRRALATTTSKTSTSKSRSAHSSASPAPAAPAKARS